MLSKANKQSRGRRIVNENGLFSNPLQGMPLETQLLIAGLQRRCYDVTVPHNVSQVIRLPKKNKPNIFPRFEVNEELFKLKRTPATINGKDGEFFGPVNRQTGLPEGTGVFIFGDWVHVVTVKDGEYLDGQRCYVNKKFREVIFATAKKQSDGTTLEKVNHYFVKKNGSLHRSSGLLRNKKLEKCELIERFNFPEPAEAKNWFSLDHNRLECIVANGGLWIAEGIAGIVEGIAGTR